MEFKNRLNDFELKNEMSRLAKRKKMEQIYK